MSKINYIANTMGKKLVEAYNNDSQGRNHLERDFSKDLALQIVEKLNSISQEGLYLQWLARMYAEKEFSLEDLTQLNHELTVFTKFKAKIENKDLNSYKKLVDLYAVTQKFEKEEPPISKKELDRKLRSEGAEVIFEQGMIKAVKLLTHEAALLYGQGTKWCTKEKATFDSYLSQGDLVAFFYEDADGKIRKYQVHYETGQFVNELNQTMPQADIDYLSEFPEYKELLEYFIRKHYQVYFDMKFDDEDETA